MMKDTPAIEINKVSFGYDQNPVLVDVNLRVNRGEFVSIVGPNGGGKTTLLKIILGLVKAQTGEIKIYGKSPDKASRLIGYMPQALEYDPQFPVTVMDVVLMGRLGGNWHGFYTKQDRQLAYRALEEVGVSDVADRMFSSISGGQRQRVLLARTIAGDPEILLLDEPTANIDLSIQHKLHSILAELNKRMTIIMVTHDFGFVSSMVENVFCVNRKVVRHPTAQITPESLRRLYAEDMRVVLHDELFRNGRNSDA